MKKVLSSRWTKALLFVLSLLPFLNLCLRYYRQDLAVMINPVEFVTHHTGDWTIRFILITLSVTPLRGLLNQPLLIRFRRMFGLFAFFYATVHFLTYIWLDKVFDFHEVWKDVYKRTFITAGFTGFVLMIPLAATSTNAMVRRLGYKRWQQLHRLIYFTALAGVIHYYWLVKSDVRLPLMYGAILLVLMLYRAVIWLR